MKKIILLLCMLMPVVMIRAQSQTKEELVDASERLHKLIYHLHIDVKPEKESQWLEWLKLSESNDQSKEDRQSYWGLFANDLALSLDASEADKKQVKTFVGFGIKKLPDYKFTAANTTPDNELGEIVKRGSGPVNLILIPPIGNTWQIFEPFMQANKDVFTMYTFTYPGFGNAPSYLRPQRDYIKRQWLSSVENALQKLVMKEKLDEVFFLGLESSVYTALKMAKHLPNKTKGVIAMNGYYPLESERSTRELADVEDKAFPFFEVFTAYMPKPPTVQSGRYLSEDMGLHMKYLNRKSWTVEMSYARILYFNELKINDLAKIVERGFETPILSILSVYSPSAPNTGFRPHVSSWQKAANNLPKLSIQTVFIPNSGDATFLDQPEKTNKVISQFTSDPEAFEPPGLGGAGVVISSPPSKTSLMLGGTNIKLSYNRPAVKGREIFGDLVPYGKVWRAGANEATSISFDHPVLINGQPLAAGKYSLFVLPEKGKWTFIFNRIIHQWGAFNYDQGSDALRIEVDVSTADFSEYMKYEFDNLTWKSLNLTLSWADRQGSLTITEPYEPPVVPNSVAKFNWCQLLEDGEKDGVSKGLADAKTMAYYYDSDTDSLWFKFDLYNSPNPFAWAVNLLFDTDMDQSNGAGWFGKHNRGFRFEKMVLHWERREKDGFNGVRGISNESGVRNRSWANESKDNLRFYIDLEKKAFFLGMKRTDVHPDLTKFNVIGAVGEYTTYNDTISNENFATIDLSDDLSSKKDKE